MYADLTGKPHMFCKRRRVRSVVDHPLIQRSPVRFRVGLIPGSCIKMRHLTPVVVHNFLKGVGV